MNYFNFKKSLSTGLLVLSLVACASNVMDDQRNVYNSDLLEDVSIVLLAGDIKTKISKRVRHGQKITYADQRHSKIRIHELSKLLATKGMTALKDELAEYGVTINQNAQKKLVITPVSSTTNVINTPKSITTLIFEVKLEDIWTAKSIWSTTLQVRDGDYLLYYNRYSEEKVLRDFSGAIVRNLKRWRLLGNKINKDDEQQVTSRSSNEKGITVIKPRQKPESEIQEIMRAAYVGWSKGLVSEGSIEINSFEYGMNNPLKTKFHLLIDTSECNSDNCSGPLYISGATDIRRMNEIGYCFTAWAKESDFVNLEEYESIKTTCRDISTGKQFWFSDANKRKAK